MNDLPDFRIRPVNNGGYAIDDHDRTVALVTRRGYVDWLLRSPLQNGPRIDAIRKDTHLSYTLGFKFILHCPYLKTSTRDGTKLVGFSHRIEDGGRRIVLIGEGAKHDGSFISRTEARLQANADGSRYEWELVTTISNASPARVLVSETEYNNVYPSLAYRGILHRGKKEFDRTLMQDRDGVVWDFPHQHSLHYGRKLGELKFDTRSWAGFFGSPRGCPVVVARGDIPLHWGICDMYYDLHCAAAAFDFEPGRKLTFEYTIKYLSDAEAREWARQSRRIPINDDDRTAHNYPRLDFGLNRFNRSVHVDLPDEGCCYRPKPPEKVWDRETGRRTKGSLRLTGTGTPLVWTSEPPIHAINGTRLQITALAKTQGVTGRGLSIRLQYYHFCWDPEPGFYPIQTLESTPLAGTCEEWTTITIPTLVIPPGEVEDGMLRLEVVLDGTGTGWVTEVNIEMSPVEAESLEHATVVACVGAT